MNTKTVKEKVEDIIYKGIPFVCSEEIYHEVADKIDKLYRKELPKELEAKEEKKFNKLLDDFGKSYTCCNIEVSEPKGTEVLCPECKEWVTTK
jgi:hypothetical protein